MVRKGGLEPPCLSAPPPQDGVSANFTTSARFAHPGAKSTCSGAGEITEATRIITDNFCLTENRARPSNMPKSNYREQSQCPGVLLAVTLASSSRNHHMGDETLKKLEEQR